MAVYKCTHFLWTTPKGSKNMKRSQETVNTRNISGVFNVLRRSDQNQNISSLNGFSEFERKAWSLQKYMLNMHSPNTMLVTKINSRDHLGKKSSCLIKREKWSILPENYFSKSKVNIKTLHLTFNKVGYKYLLLTDFKGPTVCYRPSFFCSDLIGLSMKCPGHT